ncbi:MAG: PQQ-dependent sugar dehydrogenase [Ktedonobacterales bacterium]|nr:PQQ-dependent sugar dehydrogenase [Ktedonobacterales bacterium]
MMKHWKQHRSISVLALLLFLTACQTVTQSTSVTAPGTPLPTGTKGSSLPGLQVPAGFSISLFTSGLRGSRFITFAPNGTLLVAERNSGAISALPDATHAGKASAKQVVVSGLKDPTSLVIDHGYLYVGEADQVSRYALSANLTASGKTVLVPNLPTGGSHITRTVLVGTDGMLYVSVGSSCNNCIEANAQRATVMQYHLDGNGGRIYARGLRNAVGLANNPVTGEVWVTNNGRDNLGDDIPPETLYALKDGGNYGWPRCHAGTIIDPDLGHAGDCNGVQMPLLAMQAHSAPLGLAFTTGTAFPAAYHGLFVAFHGSWNRTIPTGDKVVYIPLDAKGNVAGKAQDFVTGWQTNGHDSARPVGLAFGPDGALYISDDATGSIFRMTYTG